MRYIVVAAAKDIRRRLADPAAMTVWIGIPLLLAGLMNLVTGGGDVTPRATVLLVDQDNTLLSGLLASAGGRGSLVDLQPATLEEGRRRIDAGEATALVIVPKGFQEAAINETPSEIVLITNPAERILPGIVEEALEILVEGVFYGQQLFGPVIRRVVNDNPSSVPSDTDVAAISVEINQQIARLQNVVIPPVISLKVVADTPDEGAAPALDFGQLFLPGMLFMSFLFIATGMSVDIWEEQRMGTLRRALTTPQSAYTLLAGKLAAGVALVTAIALVALVGSIALFDVSWTRIPAALAWCAFAGGALLALLTLLQTMASSQRGAEMLANTFVFPLMMIGGSFFPFDAMPGWMAAAGQWTPNGLAVVRLKDLLFGDPSALSMLVATAGIGIPAAAAFLLAGRRLRGKFATS
jgi:ABC-type multidrug transport system permease subunit